jgi:S-adenosylmethionine hydrolase
VVTTENDDTRLVSLGRSGGSNIITLLSDFGLVDPFVGVMKGVMLARAPEARLVDLTHGIAPQDVSAGRFWLAQVFRFFPAGTVHLAVVDPTVGTARGAVVVRVASHIFVGPNNGLFGALPASAAAYRIEAERFGLSELGATFHGRDLFAPVAAEIRRGAIQPEEVGEAVPVVRDLEPPPLEEREAAIVGSVVVVDHFGNVFTNLTREHVQRFAEDVSTLQIAVAGVRVPLGENYASVGVGELLALVNAWGVIEIAERNGNAARRLGISVGSSLTLGRRSLDVESV